MEPSTKAIEIFGEVAKLAAIQELKIRLLANKTHAIQESAYEFHVAETNKAITAHFTSIGALSVANSNLLIKSQNIRNKILHCEFNEAIKKIEALVGAKAPRAAIQVIKIDPNATGKKLLDTLFAAQEAIASGSSGPHQDGSTMSDHDIGIFGGLLNCVQTGAMEQAISVFQKTNTILDELMCIETTITDTNMTPD